MALAARGRGHGWRAHLQEPAAAAAPSSSSTGAPAPAPSSVSCQRALPEERPEIASGKSQVIQKDILLTYLIPRRLPRNCVVLRVFPSLSAMCSTLLNVFPRLRQGKKTKPGSDAKRELGNFSAVFGHVLTPSLDGAKAPNGARAEKEGRKEGIKEGHNASSKKGVAWTDGWTRLLCRMDRKA